MSTAQTAQQILFQNSLAEVVRSLRNTKKNEKDTIAKCISDIKAEISSPVQNVKVMAVVKLTYFSMLGYPGDYGAFNIIEVMADSNFNNKRAGYIAAAMSFNANTGVLPLCTALFKRDLASTNQYEVGLALFALSCVADPDLARDLVSDVVSLLNHQKAYVRKKAVLCLYKLFLQFPDALRPAYPKLKEKIEDQHERADNDPSVRGAVVNTMCEMARRNPANFLSLAVPFYSLLSSVHNNWTLIKVVKVFGYFAPHEPRLGKKLVEPISNLINTSGAKSVQYECIYAVANGMSRVSSLTKLAVEKMKIFVEDPDQNLKYLGLDAMSKVMVDAPKMLHDQRDIILSCLDDPDPTIRVKSLELLKGMCTRKNLVSTVNSMFDRAIRSPPDEDWTNLVVSTIIDAAQRDDYERVQDFEWYTSILLDMAQLDISHFKHGKRIEHELVTVLTRVSAVRQYGVESLSMLLSNSNILNCDTKRSTQWMVLRAAAFVCGEYPHWLPDKRLAVMYLLSERVAILPPDVQVLCVAAAGKIHTYMLRPCDRHVNLQDGEEELKPVEDISTIEDVERALMPPRENENDNRQGIDLFCHSVFPDVQERAQFVQYCATDGKAVAPEFYAAELGAVAADAQEHVPVPEGLDLDTPFCDNIPALIPASDSDVDSDDDSIDSNDREAIAEAAKRREKQRRSDMDAFYIRGESQPPEEDLPPVVKLETLSSPPSRHASRSGKKTHTISRALSRPEGYDASSKKRSQSPEEDEATKRLKSIDITKALSAAEKLPEVRAYARPTVPGDKADAVVAEDSQKLVTSIHLEHITVGESKQGRIDFQVSECKAKKDGSLHLAVIANVTNLATSSSMYSPTITVDEGQDFVAINEVSSIIVAERVKGTATASKEFSLVFTSLPESFAEPLQLTMTHKQEKKTRTVAIALPLEFKFFASANPTTTPEDFNSTILDSLTSAPAVTAIIPLPPKTKPIMYLDDIRNKLRLTAVDTFKDCISLYAVLPAKKTHVEKANIAIVLMDEKADGVHQLTVMVKSHQVGMADAAIQAIAEIVTPQ